MGWVVLLNPKVEKWFLSLCVADPVTADGVEDAIDQLATYGPSLGRPLVDRIHGSRFHNMKELRPPRPATARSGCCSPSIQSVERCSWWPVTSQAIGNAGTAKLFLWQTSASQCTSRR